jgi:hypothetical protein
MMEVITSTETSVLTIATWRNNPEEGILHIPATACGYLWGYVIYNILYFLDNG